MVARTDESDEVIMARALQIMQAMLKPRTDYADHVLDSTPLTAPPGMPSAAFVRN